MMQRDFWRAIEAYRHDGRSGAYRCVAKHVVIFPGSRAHMSRKVGIKREWNPTGKANLAAMRMPADQRGKAGVGSMLIDFRSVRNQNGKLVMRYSGCSLFDVVDLVEMCIINPGTMYAPGA